MDARSGVVTSLLEWFSRSNIQEESGHGRTAKVVVGKARMVKTVWQGSYAVYETARQLCCLTCNGV